MPITRPVPSSSSRASERARSTTAVTNAAAAIETTRTRRLEHAERITRVRAGPGCRLGFEVGRDRFARLNPRAPSAARPVTTHARGPRFALAARRIGALEQKDGARPAEPEGTRERRSKRRRDSPAHDVAERWLLGLFEPRGRRNLAPPERQHRDDGLERGRGAERVAELALRRRDVGLRRCLAEGANEAP